jgi:uncharacterized protein (TIGR02118 family)
MIRVSGFYRWAEGAHFDHAYFNTEHARITKQVLQESGLIKFESDRFLSVAPVAGEIIAASNAYFPSLEAAQQALAKCGAALMADVPNYTSLKPEIHLSIVQTHD